MAVQENNNFEEKDEIWLSQDFCVEKTLSVLRKCHFPAANLLPIPDTHKKIPTLLRNVLSNYVTYATVTCTRFVLMGPNRACAQLTEEQLLFILFKTRQLLFTSRNKEL